MASSRYLSLEATDTVDDVACIERHNGKEQMHILFDDFYTHHILHMLTSPLQMMQRGVQHFDLVHLKICEIRAACCSHNATPGTG